MTSSVPPRFGFRFASLMLVVLAAVSACDGSGQRGGDDPFGPAIVRLGDAVASEVGGTPIYVSDVRREALAQGLVRQGENLSASSPVFSQILDELIDQRLLALEARRLGLQDSDEARRRLSTAEERILGNILLETIVDGAVTENELRRIYDEQVKIQERDDEVRARSILVETEEEAQEIVGQLAGGADFAQLALERSLDTSTRYEGGDMGYFTPDMVTPPFARAAFNTPIGRIARPFETEFGWIVLKVEDRRAEEADTFEEMRPRIVRYLTMEEIADTLDHLNSPGAVVRYTGNVEDQPMPAGAAVDPLEGIVPEEEDDGVSAAPGAALEPALETPPAEDGSDSAAADGEAADPSR